MRSRGLLTVAIALAAASAAAARIAVVGPGGGGDIECVLASRHVPGRLFAGCDVGGFYFSADSGRRWEIRNVGLGCPGVQTIAEHPTDPSRLAIGGHAGILFSADLGLHWHPATNGLPAPSPDGHSLPIVKIVWDENDTNRLWAATGIPHDGRERSRAAGTRGHIYRSDDGGESWKMAVEEDGWGEHTDPIEIYDLVACQGADGSPAAANGQRGRCPSLVAVTSRGLFRSDDAGAHWRPIGAGLPENFTARHLAAAPSRPCRLYLALREKEPAPFPREASVWRSDDGGETWSKTAPLPDRHRTSDGREVMDAWGRMAIAVSPESPDDIWLGGVWYREGLCRSRDGGETWVEALREVPRGWVNDFWSCPAVSLSISATFPSNIAFGTMSGVYASGDGGETWAQRYTAGIRGTEPANQDMGQQADDSKGKRADDSKGEGEPFSPRKAAGTGLETLCVSELLPDRFATNRLWAAFYDVGLMVSDDAGKTWVRRMGGIPRGWDGICWTLAQSPREPERLWAFFGTWGGGGKSIPARSDDGGKTWKPRLNALGWPGGVARNLQAIDCGGGSIMLAAVCDGKGLFFSRGDGESWSAAETNALPDARCVSSLASANGALYAGTRGGAEAPPRLWRSKDRGGTWEMMGEFFGEGTTSGQQQGEGTASGQQQGSASGRWQGSAVTSIAVEKRRIAVAVRCTGPEGGCWVSDDGGATWRLAYREEPWNDLNAVALGGGRIVLASRSARWHDPGFGGLGLLSSADGGATWERHVGGGLDRPEVMSLTADPFVPDRFWFGTWGNAAGRFEVVP